jgi:hypothetical protein
VPLAFIASLGEYNYVIHVKSCQKVLSKPSADSFAVGCRQKCKRKREKEGNPTSIRKISQNFSFLKFNLQRKCNKVTLHRLSSFICDEHSIRFGRATA